MRAFGLDEPTDNVTLLALQVAKARRLTIDRVMPGRGRVRVPDFQAAHTTFVAAWRRGELGDQFLDGDSI